MIKRKEVVKPRQIRRRFLAQKNKKTKKHERNKINGINIIYQKDINMITI